MSIGARIKQIRRKAGITQDTLAAALGLKRTTYAHREQTDTFDEEELEIIARILKVELQELQKWHNSPKPKTEAAIPQYGEKLIKALEDQVESQRRSIRHLETQVEFNSNEVKESLLLNRAMLMTIQKALAKLLARQDKEDVLTIANRLSRETLASFEKMRKTDSRDGKGK